MFTKYIWNDFPKKYTMYTGDTMKKTEFITFRTDKDTKESLERIASDKKWSISQLVEEIVQEWLQERSQEKTNA